MADILISFDRADSLWADWVAWALVEAGYSTDMESWLMRPGSRFAPELERIAGEARRILAILSPDYLDFYSSDPSYQGRLITLGIRGCHRPANINLCGLEEEKARDALLEGVGASLKPSGFEALQYKRPVFPGRLPRVWSVLPSRDAGFVDRERLESEIQSMDRRIVLAGHEGLGKTQAAVEYIHDHASEYDLVWWIRAEHPAVAAADYQGLAAWLELPGQSSSEQGQVLKAIEKSLEQRQSWLLVFDGARTHADIVDFLPPESGKVIITSTNPSWEGYATTLMVPALDKADSAEYLLRRAQEPDDEAASSLAQVLGNIPLALKIAGAYLESTLMRISDYQEIFKSRFWSQEQPGPVAPSIISVAADISADRVCQDSASSADLFNFCAYLGHDDIPTILLRIFAKDISDEALKALIRELERYALAEAKGDSISIHPSVQAAARTRQSDQEKRRWAGSAVHLLAGVFPCDITNRLSWSECDRLLPHALAAAEHAEASRADLEATSGLLNNLGIYLLLRSEQREAISLLERALNIDEDVFGPDHPNVARDLSNLGAVYESLSHLSTARANYERAFKIDREAYGPMHPIVAVRLNNMGSVLRAQGDLRRALHQFRRALEIDEAAYGIDDPRLLPRLYALGGLLEEMGDRELAELMRERARLVEESARHRQEQTAIESSAG
ncbi:MAG TPA: toll/interleukin-1 receptor domain-containing protein [Methanotrichaceae archaeon]|nr:toll/interleukin-1 receptor domain-containing protein [Methanotrichaceae archaeon]